MDAEQVEREEWLGLQRERLEAAKTLPKRVGSFLEDFQALDTRRAKALLQTILKAAHVHRNGRIELEFQ